MKGWKSKENQENDTKNNPYVQVYHVLKKAFYKTTSV